MNLRIVFFTALLIATALSPSAIAQSFEPFAGNWAGRASGHSKTGKEKLRCTASNRPAGSTIHLTIRCGSALQVSAVIQDSAGKLSGTWSHPFVSGTLSGVRTDNSISVRLYSAAFQANVRIEVRGNVLYVSLLPTNGKDTISVAMRR